MAVKGEFYVDVHWRILGGGFSQQDAVLRACDD